MAYRGIPQTVLDTRYLQLSGGTMTGDLQTVDLILSGGDIYPTADSTTAIQINKADGTSNVLNVDTTNGRVGIGETSPDGRLHIKSTSAPAMTPSVNADELIVENNDNAGISILTPNTSVGFLVFGDPENTSAGFLNYDHAAGQFGVGVEGTARYTYKPFELSHTGAFTISNTAGDMTLTPFANLIISQGNVGIGTTGPITKLNIASSEATTYSSTTIPALASRYLFLQNDSATDDTFVGLSFQNARATGSSASGWIGLTDTSSANGSLVFGLRNDASYAEKMRITSDGNVGIGVTDPDTRLEVFNAGNQLKLSFDATDNATFGVDTSGNLTITPSGSNFIIPDAKNIAVNTTTGTKIGTATNQKIGFFNATPVVQQAYTAVSNPPTQAEVTAIRDALVNLGFMASS